MHRFTFLPLYQACRTKNWLRVKSEVQLVTLGRQVLDVSKNAWTDCRGEFPAPEQVHINVCFLGTAPTFGPPQFFGF